MIESIQPILDILSGKHGATVAVTAWLSAWGFVARSFSVRLQKRISEMMADSALSKDVEDDSVWERVLPSTWYRITAFAIDFFLRIKLPTYGAFVALKEQKKNYEAN